MALNPKVGRRTARSAVKQADPESLQDPKVISRRYLSPIGKSEVGVGAIKKAVRATKESKARVARAR